MLIIPVIAIILGISILVALLLLVKKAWWRAATKSAKIFTVGWAVLGSGLGIYLLIFGIDIFFWDIDWLPLGLIRSIAVLLLGSGLIITVFSACGLIADMAAKKGRNWAAFFWLSALVSPLIMWIVAATIAPLSQGTPETTRQSASSSASLEEKIAQLTNLKEQGVLTEAEFASKKKDLLDKF